MKLQTLVLHILIMIFFQSVIFGQNTLDFQCYKSPDFNTSGWHYRLPDAITNQTDSFSCSVVIHPLKTHLGHGLGVALALSENVLDLTHSNKNILWGRIEFYKGISRHAGFWDLAGQGEKSDSWSRLPVDALVKVTIQYNQLSEKISITFSSEKSEDLTYTYSTKQHHFNWQYLSITSMRHTGKEKIHSQCSASELQFNGLTIERSELFQISPDKIAKDKIETKLQMQQYIDEIVSPKLPVKGEALFDTFNWENFPYGNFSYAAFKIVDAEKQPFKKALHVECLKKPKAFHTVQIASKRNTQSIKKGDMVFIQFTARCLKSSDESGEGFVSANCVIDSKTWNSIGSVGGYVSNQWKTFYGWGIAKNDYDPGSVRMHMFLSRRQQTVEVGGLVMLNLGQNIDDKLLPQEKITYEGRAESATWRQKAMAMIEKNRKGDCSIIIRTPDGKPVKNAILSVQMQKHEYGFGCYTDDHPVLNSNPNATQFKHWFKKLFNKAVVPLFWGPGSSAGGWGWENPRYKKNYLAILEWCHENQIKTQGHVLVWPSFLYTPPDVKSLSNQPQLLRQRINNHIKDVMASTQNQLDEIQVVNELYGSTDFLDVLGKDELHQWFALTKKLNANSILYINDNGILSGGGKQILSREFYLRTLDSLVQKKTPVQGIGFQAHFGTVLTEPQKIWQILDQFSKYDLPIHATEFTLDLTDEKLQADYTRDFYTAFFAHPSTQGIINWGFWAGKHYRPSCAFFTKDWKLKPNGQAYIDLVFKQWWTEETGQTDENGTYQFRGFWGDYKVSVQWGSKTQTFDVKFFKEHNIPVNLVVK